MSNAAFLLKYGSSKNISDVLNNKHGDHYVSEDIEHAIKHSPFWNAEHSKKIINDDWYHLNPKALAHKSTTSDMLHDAIDSGDVSLMKQAAKHPNSTEEHQLKIMKEPRFAVDMLLDHPNLSDKRFEEAAKSKHNFIRSVISNHPHTPDHIVHQLTKDEDPKVAASAKREMKLRFPHDDYAP